MKAKASRKRPAKPKKTAAPKKKKRVAVDRDVRRRQLLDAAGRLFSQQGYHETTVDDVTQAAGVAKGTFYLYFDDKRAVYREVIRDFLERIKEGTGFVRDGGALDPTNFFDRAVAGAENLGTLFTKERELFRMVYREGVGLDPELTSLIRKFYRDIAEMEGRNIDMAIKLGILRPCDPLLTAYMHIGMAERVILEYLEHPKDLPPIAEIVNQLMFVGYEGIRGEHAPRWPYREEGMFGTKGTTKKAAKSKKS